MTESDPGRVETPAGEVGARRRPIGVHTPDEDTSINLPPNSPDRVLPADVADAVSAAETPEPYRTPGTARAAPAAAAGTGTDEPVSERERIRRDIGRTRRELGETVEALMRRTDVRARAREKAAQAKAGIGRRARRARSAAADRAAALRRTAPVREAPAAAGWAAGGAVLLLVAWRLWRYGRDRRRPGRRRARR